MKVSTAAFGLAIWLTALADFADYTGLIKKAALLKREKKKENRQQ